MSCRFGSRLGRVFVVAALIALFAVTAAQARSHKHKSSCSPSSGKYDPRLLSPCNGATVPAGVVFTFKVKDVNPGSGYRPFLNLSSHAPRHGVLKDDTSGNGLFDGMKRVHGHRGLFTLTPPLYSFTGYWLVTAGTYYVQVQQVDCAVKGCRRYSPVEKLTVS